MKKCLLVVFILINIALPIYAQQPTEQSHLQEKLTGHISALAHDSMGGRYAGSKEMYLSADYIRKEFVAAGLVPLVADGDYYERYLLPGTKDVGINVIGALPSQTGGSEVLIFSAHYDHIGYIGGDVDLKTRSEVKNNTNAGNFFEVRRDSKGYKPPKPDLIYNGANDDASGVSALIEIANAYAEDTMPRKRTILFIAFCAEEWGLVGSNFFASHIQDASKIVANISLEMLGRTEKNGIIVSGSGLSDLMPVLNRNLYNQGKYEKGFHFQPDNESGQQLFYRSDNYPFFLKRIVSHCLIGGDGAPYYHTVKDELKTLNMKQMTRAVQMIIDACRPLLYDQKLSFNEKNN